MLARLTTDRAGEAGGGPTDGPDDGPFEPDEGGTFSRPIRGNMDMRPFAVFFFPRFLVGVPPIASAEPPPSVCRRFTAPRVVRREFRGIGAIVD